MSESSFGLEWQQKAYAAGVGVFIAIVYQTGVRLKSKEPWDWRGFVGEALIFATMGFFAIKICELCGLSAPDTSYIVLGLAFVGQKFAERVLKALIAKWLGVTIPDPAPIYVPPTPPDPDADLLAKLKDHP